MKLIYWVILLIVIFGIILMYFIANKILTPNNIENYLVGGNINNKKGACDLVGNKHAGHGGSEAIILITKNKPKHVYKIFPNFTNELWNNPKEVAKNHLREFDTEINIYKKLTTDLVDIGITPHIVKYLDDFYCEDSQQFFNDCPKSYLKFLKSKNTETHCENYYRSHPVKALQKKCKILELEYCDYSGSEFLMGIIKLPIKDIRRALDIFIFQILITIQLIKVKYPHFSHNDLFIRNILGQKITKKTFDYEYNGIKYRVEAERFNPKINDFGLSNLNKKYKQTNVLIDSDYKDIYLFILDIYHIIVDQAWYNKKLINRKKFELIREYFNSFFDINKIEEFTENHPWQMYWNWNQTLDPDFVKAINAKHPDWLLKNYFNIFAIYN